MGVVRFRPNVKILAVEATARLLAAADNAAELLEMDVVVTSGAEECGRKETDPHMRGMALDFGTKQYSPEDTLRFFNAMTTFLGRAQWTVLFEGPTAHPDPRLEAIRYKGPSKPTGFHIHSQVKIGAVYP